MTSLLSLCKDLSCKRLIAGIWTLALWAPKIGLSLTEAQMSLLHTAGTPWLCVVALGGVILGSDQANRL